MNCLLLIGVLSSLCLVCRAEGEAEGECEMSAMAEFHKDIAGGLCKPTETDTARLKALVDCKKHLGDDEQLKKKMEFLDGLGKKLYETCGKPNEDDIKEYTKCDLNDEQNKMILMLHCSAKFQECLKTEADKRREEWKKDHPDAKTHKNLISDDKKKELKECMHKAAYGQ